MKRFFRIFLLLLIGVIFIYTLYYLYNKSQKAPEIFSTETPFYGDIINKSVATGSIIPREEIEIKPQVSGIINEVYVEAGDKVVFNEEIARIQVIPDMVSLNNAENRVEVAQLALNNAKLDYDRNKTLYEKNVISRSEYQQFDLSYNNARQELEAARDNLQIIREGASRKAGRASLNVVKATIPGMVLDVPVKVGNQVIESNNFNEGTTIASVADMTDLIFEGKIDESEVGKIREGMPILLTVGAIENKRFNADLEYISPKGVEENGAIQFMIRARVKLDSSDFIRAGYSANADIVLSRRDSVLAIKESLVQYEDGKPFVEVATGDQQFEKRPIELGLSDGINVELLGGIPEDANIKVWNRSN
ncbi:MAG: efflux RND transporter periplasmic adaptor subunit [Owenweeksia sp.]